MAITSQKKYSKIPERGLIIGSILFGIGIFFTPTDCVGMTASIGNDSVNFFQGCVIGLFVVPILFAFPITVLGLYLRHRRIKKELK